MLFNSLEFALFFPIVTIVYFLLNNHGRILWLLAASCLFYMAFKPEYILILAFTIIIDFYAGILIENAEGKRRKQWLIMSLVANIGVLVVFKYYNFLVHHLPNNLFDARLGEKGVPFLTIALPIGLSFHTFQAMSYTIEVYRGNQKAERKFDIYALYVMFYPQLVAGPIERPQNILPQFYVKHPFSYDNVRNGLQLMAWGLFKKVVIADRLAVFVDQVYNYPLEYEGISFLVGAFFFSFQIYCDFSGYSDIAIGAALVMGYKLMLNFRNPYFAQSISDFWRRWHISLSTWFRDYLYIPLGGNRVGKERFYLNTMIVFLISGIWHGANINYVVWGAMHGFYLIFAAMTQQFRDRFNAAIGFKEGSTVLMLIKILITYVLVTLAWIAFRSDYNNYFFQELIFDRIMHTWDSYQSTPEYFRQYVMLDFPKNQLLTGIAFIVFLLCVNFVQEKHSVRDIINRQKAWVRWSIYLIFCFLFIYFGVFESASQFIYFQF